MDTESAWRERYCKEDFTFQDIVSHLREDSFTDDIFEGYENTKTFRWVAVFNEFWPQEHLDYADLWKGIKFLSCYPNLGTKSLFFFCERLSASMARSLHLSFMPRLLFAWQPQYTETPGEAAARVVALWPRLLFVFRIVLANVLHSSVARMQFLCLTVQAVFLPYEVQAWSSWSLPEKLPGWGALWRLTPESFP